MYLTSLLLLLGNSCEVLDLPTVLLDLTRLIAVRARCCTLAWRTATDVHCVAASGGRSDLGAMLACPATVFVAVGVTCRD